MSCGAHASPRHNAGDRRERAKEQREKDGQGDDVREVIVFVSLGQARLCAHAELGTVDQFVTMQFQHQAILQHHLDHLHLWLARTEPTALVFPATSQSCPLTRLLMQYFVVCQHMLGPWQASCQLAPRWLSWVQGAQR